MKAEKRTFKREKKSIEAVRKGLEGERRGLDVNKKERKGQEEDKEEMLRSNVIARWRDEGTQKETNKRVEEVRMREKTKNGDSY